MLANIVAGVIVVVVVAGDGVQCVSDVLYNHLSSLRPFRWLDCVGVAVVDY